MTSWVEDIQIALLNLGGVGTLQQIYDEVRIIRNDQLPTSFQACIRERIEAHSSDSINFHGKDYFKKVEHGVWALRETNYGEGYKLSRNSALKNNKLSKPGNITMEIPNRLSIECRESSVLFEDVSNILRTIKQYREYQHPGSSSWKEYVLEFFHLLGFSTKEMEPRLFVLGSLILNHENQAIVCYIDPNEDFVEVASGITWDSYIQHAAIYYNIDWGVLTNGLQLKLLHFIPNRSVEETHWTDLDAMINNERIDAFFSLFSAFSLIKDPVSIHMENHQRGILKVNLPPSEQPDRHKLRLLFWGQLLDKAKSRTRLHSRRSPTTDNWISAGAGKSGFELSYVIRMEDAQVDLWIDRHDYDENKRLFNQFLVLKDDIERKFGDSLKWELLPDNRASKISYIIPGSGLLETDKWEIVQEKLIDAMVRMEYVFKPYILKV